MRGVTCASHTLSDIIWTDKSVIRQKCGRTKVWSDKSMVVFFIKIQIFQKSKISLIFIFIAKLSHQSVIRVSTKAPVEGIQIHTHSYTHVTQTY